MNTIAVLQAELDHLRTCEAYLDANVEAASQQALQSKYQHLQREYELLSERIIDVACELFELSFEN